MDFPEALHAALSARYPAVGVQRPPTHRQGLTARMRALERQFGGKAAAARAAGISPRSWRDWSHKSHKPSAASLRKLEQAYQQHVRAPLLQRRAPTHVAINAVVVAHPGRGPGDQEAARYMNRTPHRKFNAEKVDNWAPVVDAWAVGGKAAAAAAALDAIKTAYGEPFAFEGDEVTVEL